jgi:rhodanese-related sulfurtransferase
MKKSMVFTLVLVFIFSSIALAKPPLKGIEPFCIGCHKEALTLPGGVYDPVYPIKGKHKGGNVTPKRAYEMMKKDPKHTFLVDVRTRYEYMDIGHPVGAYHIPWKFYSTDVGKRGYQKELNKNFCNDLKARFNPDKDTLLLLCRSAARTIAASTAAVDCGFKKDKVFNVLGGFEGDTVKDKGSPHYGKRMVGGWRLEGLPWTYRMNPNLMYQADFKK